MFKGRQDVTLTVEPFLLAGDESRSDHFDGEAPGTMQAGVLCQVHQAGSALPDMPQHPIPAYDVAGDQGCGKLWASRQLFRRADIQQRIVVRGRVEHLEDLIAQF